MAVPKQPIGLTNFSGSITSCPPNPDAIRSIVFTKCDNLSVVNGAKTEIQISLTDFYIPVDNASRVSFTVPGVSGPGPSSILKLDLAGVDKNGGVKFICLLPQYKGTTGNKTYMEWCNLKTIDEGPLLNTPTVGLTGNSSFNIAKINSLSFSWGGYLGFDNVGSGSLYIGSDGGLLKWDGNSMTLWNTLNSQIGSDYINSIVVDSSNTVWMATNIGVLSFNENNTQNQFNKHYTFPSNNVKDIKMFPSGNMVVATDNGISIFDQAGTTFSNYNVYNSPLLKHNIVSCVDISSDLFVFAGTTGGVYAFDSVRNKWNAYPLNSSTVVGWSAPNTVQSLASYDGNLYVGTTGGMVVIPYTGMTASTVPFQGMTASTVHSGASGPWSNNFLSLKIESYQGSTNLYAGHPNGISAYNVGTSTWWSNVGSSSPVYTVVTDFLSSPTNPTIFYGSTGSGVQKYLTNPQTYGEVPDLGTTNPQLLMSVPAGGTSNGNYTLDSSKLYSVDQSLYLVFSKNMSNGATSGANVENFIELLEGITGAGNQVSGAFSWDYSGRVCTFSPSSPLNRAQGYNFRVAQGGSSDYDGNFLYNGLDVGFYTESIEPLTGWNSLGKMLVLSGSDVKYTDSIYLRNPQSMDINVIALIGG